MATVTLSPTKGWAVGETISAYETNRFNQQQGAAVTTAAVAADSTVTFTGLDADKFFIATDGGTEVQFTTLTASSTTVGADVPRVNVFDTDWPDRPDATIVLWIGGDASDNSPSADMEVGDLWFPASE